MLGTRATLGPDAGGFMGASPAWPTAGAPTETSQVWLGSGGVLENRPAEAPGARGAPAWFVPVPPAASSGPVRVAGVSVTVIVHEGPAVEPGAAPLEHLDTRTVAAWRESSALVRALQTAARETGEAWRARSLAAALGIELGTPAPPAGSVSATLAEQESWRWGTALERLRRADAGVADRVHWRLVAAADFGQGVAMPLWPRGAATTALLHALLAPDADDASVRAAAERWLAALPEAASWVVTDAGAPAAHGENVPAAGVVAVLNFGRAPAAAWVAPALARPGAPDMTPAPPWSVAVLPAPLAPARDGISHTRLTVRLGGWAAEHSVSTFGVPAAPPGPRLGPLQPDLTMAALLGEPEPPGVPQMGRTGAVLYREAPSGDRRVTSGWTVYVECATESPGERLAGSEPDSVRLWLGPTGAPVRVLRVTEDGAVLDETPTAQSRSSPSLVTPSGSVSVRRAPGRWEAWVPIPGEAIDASGLLPVGLERQEPGAGRSAWPRAMLPWQAEPGRAVFDLGAWEGELGRPGEARPLPGAGR
ncbi:MAG TPA: hypothetical protein VD963_08560, partial [Phycisphaerales bacterium]|nr:hypothetical protein [Phycisphaerales bacterium]